VSELLDAVKGSPLLLAFIVVGGFLVYAVEKLGGLDGPITRALRAWQDRELNRLRREALLRAEQRKLDTEQESAVIARLRAEVAWLNRERADQRRRDRLRDQHDRALAGYLGTVLRAARAGGLNLPPPPEPPELAPLFVDGDEADPAPSTVPTHRAHRRDSPRPAVPGR
jgi:hypothetical protein